MDKTKIKEHFNKIADNYDYWKRKNSFYYEQLKIFYREHVPQKQAVLEVGCGTADILGAVDPREGIGVDISEGMIRLAKNKYPQMKFLVTDAEALALKKQFKYIIMSDLLDHVSDIYQVIRETETILEEGSYLILNTINPLWSLFFDILEALKLKMPEGPHNFIAIQDISSLVGFFSFKVEQEGYFLLLPKRLFIVSYLLNKYAPGITLLRKFCFCQYVIARKEKAAPLLDTKYSVSIVIPCYNEEGNIALCYSRIPDMGSFQEIIFVNDGSVDRTKDKIQKLMEKDAQIKLISYPQRQGKGYAVKKGFEAAGGDVLIILDADTSVMPEELPKFLRAIVEGKADFINGTRMVYPVEQHMNIIHILGNKFFSLIFSWLLGQRITDTLCGTKALLRKDYAKIRLLSKNDPWGDFDLLIGAAKLGLRIKEMPVRYQKRVFGYSKMQPFKHGFILFLRVIRGFKEMKIDKWLKTNKLF